MIESLEVRRLLAAPVLDAIADITDAPGGKPIIIPFAASDADNQVLTYTIASSNPKIKIDVHRNSVWLKLTVASSTTSYGTMTSSSCSATSPPKRSVRSRASSKQGFMTG